MKARRDALLVLGFAILVRLVVLLDVRDAPFWGATLGDENTSIELARSLLAGLPPPHGAWYVSPGYAYFLAFVFGAGGGFSAAKLLNLAAGALGALLVWGIARRIAGRRAAVAAGWVWALYPAMLLQEILILKSSLAVLCVLGALVAIPRADAPPSDRSLASAARWLLAGIACGAAALLRAELLLLPFGIAAAGLLARRRRWPGAPALAGLVGLLVAATLPAIVPTLQNRAWSGDWVPIAFGGGPNFYIGNNPDADGSYVPLRPDRSDPRQEEVDAVELASAALGHEAPPSAVSRYWYARGLEWWRREPWRAAALTAKKVVLLWGPHELTDTYSTALAGRWVSLLRDPFVGPALVLPAALVGLWITRRRRDLWPLHAALAAATVAIVPFFLFERFRLHVVAIAVSFAAAAGERAVQSWRERRWRRLAIGLTATVGIGLLAALPRAPRDEDVLRANLGDLLMSAARYEEALREYDSVRAASPEMWRIDLKIANAQVALGRPGAALAALGRVLPRLYAEGERTGLPSVEEIAYAEELAGDLEAALDRFSEAAPHYEMALRFASPAERSRLGAKLAACRTARP